MADDGKFSIRPDGAAPIFDSKSGRAAARKRWDAARARTEDAIVLYANANNPDQEKHTAEEAYDFVVRAPQFKASREGKTAAAKFVSQMGDLLPAGGMDKPQQVVNDNRRLMVLNFNTKNAIAYVDQLEENGEPILAALVKAQIDEDQDEHTIEVPVSG